MTRPWEESWAAEKVWLVIDGDDGRPSLAQFSVAESFETNMGTPVAVVPRDFGFVEYDDVIEVVTGESVDAGNERAQLASAAPDMARALLAIDDAIVHLKGRVDSFGANPDDDAVTAAEDLLDAALRKAGVRT